MTVQDKTTLKGYFNIGDIPTESNFADLIDSGVVLDGWIAAEETWTYASADDPTFTFTISGDKTGKYSVGMRVKLTQTSAKYFIITKVEYSDPNTTVTIYGGTDYDLANAAITSPFYSVVKAPQGFPLDPIKWTVTTTDTTLRSQTSPTQNTWYNPGSITISIPIGCWRVTYKATVQLNQTAAGQYSIESTLSTANNSESDGDFTYHLGGYVTTSSAMSIITSIEKHLNLSSKTSYFLNIMTPNPSIDSIHIHGAEVGTIIRAICAYL